MRIVYHHRTQADDGQAVHIRSLVRAFEAEGHDVHEVGLVQQADQNGRAAGGRSRWGWVTRMPRAFLELAEYGYNGIARRRLARAALRFEADFIYERYAFGNVAGVLAARRIRCPLVLEVNSPMVEELQRTRGLVFRRTAQRIEEFAFRSADRVCVVSGVLRDMLVEVGVDRERILVTPNGVHPELYLAADPAAAQRAARADLGVPADGLVLGFVGFYRDWHRLDLVLEALRRPALATARLVLVGEGPARTSLESRAAELGVAERVIFAGRRPHERIPELLHAFDIALVPAINAYASPLKLHEYMAAGLASVAPDQPNLREVLSDNENALLVAPEDAAALGHALEKLARDDTLRARLGAAARQTIVDRELTWRGNARRVATAVEGLLT